MRIPVEKKKDDLESWLQQLQKQILELKPDNEEVQAKLKELQVSLDQTIKNQAKQQSQQIQCQKQITLLRSQIETASDAKNIQPLQEKIQQLESELTLIKTKPAGMEITVPLKAVQEELLTLKKSSEQVAKINSSLRNQLQAVIETSDRQAQQLANWQKELAQQTRQQEELVTELQVQLNQIKTTFSKRLAALEGRVSGLEVRHESLSTKVRGQDPEITVGQKLLKLRQAILEDKAKSDELKYYVAPNGEDRPGLGDHEALYEWTQINFLDAKAEARVLLLQGQAGTGKSTFNCFLLKHLWQDKAWETFRPGDKAPSAYVPILIPLGHPRVNPTALLNYLADLTELTEDFTEAEVNVLKRDYRLLLIADGYDEMPGRQALNLYDVNQLDQYEGRFKLLIGCRTQRVLELDETIVFVPHDRESKPRYFEFKRRHVSPFNDTQIRDYLTKYLAQNKDRTDITLWKEAKDYEDSFARMPELKALISTPFLLLMSIEILPTIIAETSVAESKDSKTADTQKLTRSRVYDYFMENWFIRQVKIAHKSGDTTPQKLLIQHYRQFCLKFAERLRAAGITSVQYPYGEEALFEDDLLSDTPKAAVDPQGPRGPWVKKLLGMENEAMHRARQGAPLMIGTGNYYQFIHASLIDYFLTTAIAEQARLVITPTPISAGSIRQKQEAKAEPILLPGAESDSIEVLLKQGPLTRDQVALLVDRVQADVALKEILFRFIERSKKEEPLAQAAANAITVLNAARVSFSGMDFKGIRIPGADLSQAVLDSTQLQGADLNRVTLSGAWLRQANLSQSKMTDVEWGEWPSLTLPDEVTACAYSLDGRWLAGTLFWNSQHPDKYNIYLYDAKQRTLQQTLKGHSKPIESLVFDARGERLASGGYDKSVCLWQVATGQLERTFEGHTDSVTKVAFDIRGEHLASGSWDKTVRMWNVITGRLKYILKHTGMVYTVVFDASGERLASGGVDNTIYLWRVNTGLLEHTFKDHTDSIHHSPSVYSVTFDASGGYLASGCNDHAIRLWQIDGCRLVRTIKGHTETVCSVAFDAKGERLVSGSSDNTVRLWQVATGRLECTLEGHSSIVSSVAFDMGDKRIVSIGDNKVRLWQVPSAQLEHATLIKGHHTNSIMSITFDAQGEHLASGSHDNSICLWRAETGQLERKLEHEDKIMFGIKTNPGCVTSVTFDTKSERLASASWDHTVRLWKVSTGALERKLEGHKSFVHSVSIDSQGKLLASGSMDKTVRLWQMETGHLERTFEGHEGTVSSVAFDASGERLASGSWDKTVRLWQVDTGRLEHILDHTESVQSVSFDAKGERLASGGNDCAVRLWRVATGQLEFILKGHTKFVRAVAFDIRGERLASGSNDSTVRLWQISTGACLAVIQGFNGSVNSVAWQPSATGTFIATGSSDKAVRYWQIEEARGEKDKLNVMLRWTSHQAALTAHDACLDGVIGLDDTGRDLLQQRGAKGTPAEFKSRESQIEKASSSPAKKDPTNIRSLATPAARLGLLATPSVPTIPTSVSVGAKAIAEPKTL